VVANRLGYATTLVCNSCGTVRAYPGCGDGAEGRCESCGSERLSPTGIAVERVREMVSAYLGEPVGLLTAARHELAEAPVVVGTAHCILEREWDAVLIPDADAFLAGGAGSAERAFRTLYGAAEAARELLVVQTRLPEHYVLREAVRGDYLAFAAVELPRLRALGYPPFAHLASMTLEGREAFVRRAVESRLRPALEPGVEMAGPVSVGRAGKAPVGGAPAWRLLLRARERSAVARAAGVAARLAAESGGLKARVEVDPEEV
jgi:primosomal protein N' (replication factor Y)